jgi:hypothetical protein
MEICIRRIVNYQTLQALELKGRNCISVSSPYDEELKESIKGVIPWKLREYRDRSWAVIEDDPDQKPDEQTNLEFLRQVAKECADRRGWKVRDFTLQSEEQVAEQRAEEAQDELEAHIAAVSQILRKMPPHSLRMTGWNSKRISLQLEHYLGEENYDLFMELFRSSKEALKVQWLGSWEKKRGFGFEFSLVNCPEIVRVLIEENARLRVKYLDSVALQITQELPSGAVRMASPKGGDYLGLDICAVDMSENEWSSNSWQVAQVGDRQLWVCELEPYIRGWVSQSSQSVMSFGGRFGIFMQQRSRLPELIEIFELQEWFREWSRSLLESEVLSGYSPGLLHPADDLICHIKGFGQGYGGDRLSEIIGPEYLAERVQAIAQLKEAKKMAANAEKIRNAKKLAAQKIRKDHPMKADLIKYSHGTNVAPWLNGPVKKSWTIEKIVEHLTADQDFCERLIGIQPAIPASKLAEYLKNRG